MNQGAEMGRALAWSRYAFLGIFGCSAYQCTKLATLSPSGRLLAPVGAAAGLFLFQATFTANKAMRAIIDPPAPETPAAE